jgi:hypothetical protein
MTGSFADAEAEAEAVGGGETDAFALGLIERPKPITLQSAQIKIMPSQNC